MKFNDPRNIYSSLARGALFSLAIAVPSLARAEFSTGKMVGGTYADLQQTSVGLAASQLATLKKELRNHYMTGRKIIRLTTLSAIRGRAAELADEVSFLAEGAPSKVKRTIAKAGASFEFASKQRSRAAAVQKMSSGINFLLRANRAI